MHQPNENRKISLHQNYKFCASKDTIKKVRRQLIEWGK